MEKVVGPVCHITCDDRDAMYVGEMERSLKDPVLRTLEEEQCGE